MPKVPFFGLDRQFKRYRKEFLDIAETSLASGQALQGEDVRAFEKSLCATGRRKEAVAVGSCTDAIAFALIACGVGPGDEVMVTSFSFFASVSPILRVGAVPRFVDIEPDYHMMNLDLLDRLVTPRTKAIMAVHLFGQTFDMQRVENFAQKHGLLIIEDAAQALGAMDGERPAGSLGIASCLSFDPTKVIGSFSSAGALLTDDEDIAEKARSLRYHGRGAKTRRYEILGFNSQLSTEMAGMLNFKLSKMAEWEQERNVIAMKYIDGLSGIKEVSLPKIRNGSSHNWHKFVIRAGNRDMLQAHLEKNGIQCMIHYPTALCDEPLIKRLGLPEDATRVPEARKASASVLSLPIFPDLYSDEVERVIASIRDFYLS